MEDYLSKAMLVSKWFIFFLFFVFVVVVVVVVVFQTHYSGG